MTRAGTRPVGGGKYDFTALGWLQFEQLCAHLLHLLCGVDPTRWVGAADTSRWVTVDGDAVKALGATENLPAVVRVVWLPRRTDSLDDARRHVRRAMRDGEPVSGGQVLVLTNVWADDEFSELVAECAGSDAEMLILGRLQLDYLIEANRDLWVAMPSLLGVRELDDLVGGDVLAASHFDLEAARALAPTFVATAAYERCCETMGRHRFSVLTGPPEMGKTAAARMLGLVKLCQGWEVHECTTPKELWEAFDRDRRQMFIADDAFGSTEYRSDAAEHWAVELDRILKHTDENHWLVWTYRVPPRTPASAGSTESTASSVFRGPRR